MGLPFHILPHKERFPAVLGQDAELLRDHGEGEAEHNDALFGLGVWEAPICNSMSKSTSRCGLPDHAAYLACCWAVRPLSPRSWSRRSQPCLSFTQAMRTSSSGRFVQLGRGKQRSASSWIHHTCRLACRAVAKMELSRSFAAASKPKSGKTPKFSSVRMLPCTCDMEAANASMSPSNRSLPSSSAET